MAELSNPPSNNLWTEPESAANVDNQPQYPYNNITQTQSGHAFELDDTPGRERVRLQHRSKTFVEFHPNGDAVYKVFGTGYEIHMNGKNVLIKGTCNITVEGDCNMHVTGDYNHRVDGDYFLTVGKSYNVRSADTMNIQTDDDVKLSAGTDYSGAIYFNAPDNVYINSDLVVGGSINADIITSKTRVDAGTGVSAGVLGVYSTGPITSLISVQAPLGTFSIMKSILMTDIVNTKMHNFHIHPTPKGPSGLPTLSMV